MVISLNTRHPWFKSVLVHSLGCCRHIDIRLKSVFFYVITQGGLFHNLRRALGAAGVSDGTLWAPAVCASFANVRVAALNFSVFFILIDADLTCRVWSVNCFDLWNFICVAVNLFGAAWTVSRCLSRSSCPLSLSHHWRLFIHHRRTGLRCVIKIVGRHGISSCWFAVTCFLVYLCLLSN